MRHQAKSRSRHLLIGAFSKGVVLRQDFIEPQQLLSICLYGTEATIPSRPYQRVVAGDGAAGRRAAEALELPLRQRAVHHGDIGLSGNDGRRCIAHCRSTTPTAAVTKTDYEECLACQ